MKGCACSSGWRLSTHSTTSEFAEELSTGNAAVVLMAAECGCRPNATASEGARVDARIRHAELALSGFWICLRRSLRTRAQDAPNDHARRQREGIRQVPQEIGAKLWLVDRTHENHSGES